MRKIYIMLIGLVSSMAMFCAGAFCGLSTLPIIKAYPQDEESEGFYFDNDIGIGGLFDNEKSQSDDISDESESYLESESSLESSSISSLSGSSSSNIGSSSATSSSSSSQTSSVSSNSSQSSSLPPSSSSEAPSEQDDYINILAGAVQAEIIGSNSPPIPARYEAYKAQAVASNSYMQYYKKQNGKYPPMPYKAPNAKTIELVKQVQDKLIYYKGAVINASYHAYSGGHTQSSEYVWGTAVPYLRGVQSKYDEYPNTYTISTNDASLQLNKKLGITTFGDPTSWFSLSTATRSDGGHVDKINVCGTTTTGRKLRENVFGPANIKSPNITKIDVVGDKFIFHTKGYGHGVGMSQGGAIGYAEKEGYSYVQILKKYYTGVEIK